MLTALEIIRRQTSALAFAVAIYGLGEAVLRSAFRNFNTQLATTNTIPNPDAGIDILPLLGTGLEGFIL